MAKKALMYIVAAGFLLALMRMFNWDPFGVATWICDSIWNLINRIADWFTSMKSFRDATKKPLINKHG